MNKNLSIFLRFLWRDFYVYSKQIRNFAINYCLIYPLVFTLSFGYIIPNVNFGSAIIVSKSVILAGSIVIILMILPFTLNLFLLLDLEGDKFTEYQILLMPPRLVILEKIIFSSIFNFLLLLPYFVVAKIILNDNFDTCNLSIFKLLLNILSSCFVLYCSIIFFIP